MGFIQNQDSNKLETGSISAASLINSIIQSYPGTLAKQMLNKLLSNDKILKEALKGDFEKFLVNVSFYMFLNVCFF